MSRSIVRRPVSLYLAAMMLAVGAIGAVLTYHYRHNVDKCFMVALITVIGVVAVTALPHVRPVYPTAVGLALSVFSGYWSQFGVPIGVDRPLLIYGVAAALVQALPDSRPHRLPALSWVGWLLIFVGLYAIVSAGASGTLSQHASLFALLDQLSLVGFALFILAPTIFATERDRDILLVTLVVVGAYLGCVSLFEGLHFNSLVFPSYILNPSLGIHAGRARGPFLEAVANGMMLYTCGVAAAMGFAKWKMRRARAACLIVILLSALGIVFTLTREVWIGSAVATAVTMVAYKPLRRFVLPSAVCGVIVVLGALTFVPGLHTSASSRASDSRSVWDRLNSDAAGLRMVNARPLFGFGWYRFGDVGLSYYRQAATYPLTTVGRIHNVFLGVAVDLGIIGFAAWLLALLGAVGQALWRRGPPEAELWRVGLIAVAIDWLIVANFTPLTYALPNHVMWLWPGVVIAAAPAGTARRRERGAVTVG